MFKSLIQLVIGVAMLTFLAGPLLGNILNLSDAMNAPSFLVSFVVVPLALNGQAAIAALLPASKKTKGTSSLTFSEVPLSLPLYISLSPLSQDLICDHDMITDIWRGDHEQHIGIDGVAGDSVREELDMGFFSRGANNNGGVCSGWSSGILEHNLPSMDMHTSIPPLPYLFGALLLFSGCL